MATHVWHFFAQALVTLGWQLKSVSLALESATF